MRAGQLPSLYPARLTDWPSGAGPSPETAPYGRGSSLRTRGGLRGNLLGDPLGGCPTTGGADRLVVGEGDRSVPERAACGAHRRSLAAGLGGCCGGPTTAVLQNEARTVRAHPDRLRPYRPSHDEHRAPPRPGDPRQLSRTGGTPRHQTDHPDVPRIPHTGQPFLRDEPGQHPPPRQQRPSLPRRDRAGRRRGERVRRPGLHRRHPPSQSEIVDAEHGRCGGQLRIDGDS